VCLSRYGAAPVRGEVCHEAGVRILVASIARQAARYHRTVVPVLSASINFYFRVFLRVHDSPAEVTRLGTRLAHVYKCVYCSVFYTQPLLDAQPRGGGVHYQAPHAPPSGGLCGECGSRLRMGGPLWTAPLHDREWLDRALAALRAEPQRFATRGAMEALLTLLRDELPDAPLFYSMPELCRALRLRPVKTVLVRSALLNAGFRVSQAHTSPTAVKTDAPAAAVMDVMRCLVQRGLTATSAGKPPRGARPRAAAAAAAAAGAAAPAAPKAAAAGEGAQEEEEDEEAAAQQAQQAEEAARLSPAATVFARPPRLAADFSERADAHVDDGVPRFLPNPEENWGPKARATGKREPPRADAHAHAHAEGKRPRPEGRAPAASAASASASSSSSAPRH
jgi:tRNA (guanine26-N2/guanine27-N2)-dimethyltransferase